MPGDTSTARVLLSASTGAASSDPLPLLLVSVGCLQLDVHAVILFEVVSSQLLLIETWQGPTGGPQAHVPPQEEAVPQRPQPVSPPPDPSAVQCLDSGLLFGPRLSSSPVGQSVFRRLAAGVPFESRLRSFLAARFESPLSSCPQSSGCRC